jgi:ferritin-like metal-binding protein YciE
MADKSAREVFVQLLSDLRHGTERTTKLLGEISQMAQDPDVRQALEARVFVSNNILESLDECFRLIGERPAKVSGRMQEIFAEDFRKELGDIHEPSARRFFILAKASQLVHFRVAEYKALIAAADLSGHYGVAVLLDSGLADTVAFAERTSRLINLIIEAKLGEKITARSAA